MESSGLRIEKLDYEGESDDGAEKMTDDDVLALSEALQKNEIFQGPLDLSKNGLSDLSALYLKDALARPGAVNITKLNMS